MDTEFTTGATYEWYITIDGRVIPIKAKFTGRTFNNGSEVVGRFENVKTGNPYLLTKEGYEKLQLVENDVLADGEIW